MSAARKPADGQEEKPAEEKLASASKKHGGKRQQSADFSGSEITVIVPHHKCFVQDTESHAQDCGQYKYFAELAAHQCSAVFQIRAETFDILEYLLICQSYILASCIADYS